MGINDPGAAGGGFAGFDGVGDQGGGQGGDLGLFGDMDMNQFSDDGQGGGQNQQQNQGQQFTQEQFNQVLQATQTVAQQNQQLQSQVTQMENFRQGLQSLFDNGDGKRLTREQLSQQLNTFAQNPYQTVDQRITEALNTQVTNLVDQKIEDQRLITEFESKHPELVPYRDYIRQDVDAAWNALIQQGKPQNAETKRQAIELGVQSFQKAFQPLQQQQVQQTQNRQMTNAAINLNLNPGGASTGTTGQGDAQTRASQMWGMSDSEFGKLLDKGAAMGKW